ncbi:MAG: Wzy polymerase domain-containing protein [Burkholderiales bacterium]|nr:Wzy polymerase domain-containing protein [Burkholderiales bacterium]
MISKSQSIAKAGASVAEVSILLLCLPWLNPLTNGPSYSVVQWLGVGLGACLCWVIWSLDRTSPDERTRAIAAAWLAAATASAVIGLLQYLGLAEQFGGLINATALGEAYANLRQRNQFATLTSIGLLALLWQVQQWQGRPASSAQATAGAMWAVGVAALLLAVGNAASGSRTGLLQWLLVVALTALWSARGQRQAVAVGVGALLAYLLAALALPLILQAATGAHSGGLLARFQEEADCGSRRILWSNVLHLIAQKPWAGWGWGNLDYAHFVTLYPGDRFCEIVDNAHNLPLHLAVELGVPLALALCAAGAWLVWRARPWREFDPTRQIAWGVLAMLLLHSMVEYPLWYGPFQLAAALSVWLLWRTLADHKPQSRHCEERSDAAVHAARSHGLLHFVRNDGKLARDDGKLARDDEGVRPRNDPRRVVFPVVAATALIALLSYVTWDYWRVSQLYLAPQARASVYRDNTLDKVRGSWFFQDQVRFAELTTTALTRANAEHIFTLAQQMLYFSPEPRVIEKLIESAVMLGRDDEALFYLQRYKAAFPQAHARWANPSGGDKTP